MELKDLCIRLSPGIHHLNSSQSSGGGVHLAWVEVVNKEELAQLLSPGGSYEALGGVED